MFCKKCNAFYQIFAVWLQHLKTDLKYFNFEFQEKSENRLNAEQICTRFRIDGELKEFVCSYEPIAPSLPASDPCVDDEYSVTFQFLRKW